MNIFRFKEDDLLLNNENYRMIPLELINHNFYLNHLSISPHTRFDYTINYERQLPAPFSTYKELIKEYNRTRL